MLFTNKWKCIEVYLKYNYTIAHSIQLSALLFHKKLFLWLSLHEKSSINILKNVVFDVSWKTVYSWPRHEGVQISIVQVNYSFNSVLLQSSRSPVIWFLHIKSPVVWLIHCHCLSSCQKTGALSVSHDPGLDLSLLGQCSHWSWLGWSDRTPPPSGK